MSLNVMYDQFTSSKNGTLRLEGGEDIFFCFVKILFYVLYSIS